jgi:hypothetical protein
MNRQILAALLLLACVFISISISMILIEREKFIGEMIEGTINTTYPLFEDKKASNQASILPTNAVATQPIPTVSQLGLGTRIV